MGGDASFGDQFDLALRSAVTTPKPWTAGSHNTGDVVLYAGGLWTAQGDFTDQYFDTAAWQAMAPQTPLRPSALWLPHQPAPTVVTAFQTGHGFTAANASANSMNDTSDFVIGSQAVTATTQGNGTNTTIKNTAVASFDTTGKQVVIVGKIENAAHLAGSGGRVTISLGNDSGFANFFKFTVCTFQQDFQGGTDGQWIRIVLNFADATQTGSPTRSGIVAVQFLAVDDNTGNPVKMHWNQIGLIPEPSTLFPNGVCSICMDDCYGSQFTNAKPIMDAAGFAHTKFVIQSVLGAGGRLTLNQLLSEQDLGMCELAGHAYTDSMHGAIAGYNTFTQGQVEADLYMLKQWMVQNGLRNNDIYAYPAGFQQLSTVNAVRQLFTAACTTNQATLETLPPGDPLRMRRISGVGSFGSNTPAIVNARIDAAKTNHAWILPTFHDITSGAATTAIQCSAADFQTIISHIQSSGIAVLPVGEVLKQLS